MAFPNHKSQRCYKMSKKLFKRGKFLAKIPVKSHALKHELSPSKRVPSI